ncbi:efflux RND transporter permease subunit [Caminibacter profundus]
MFEFFYRRSHLLFSIIAGMFIFGVLGLIKMPQNLFPEANRPEVLIFTTIPGASAKVAASTVSKPIEEELATLSNVYEIKSTNVANFSIVRVVFDYKKTLQEAAVDVTNAINRIKSNLPANVISSIYLVGDFTAPIDVFALIPNGNITLPEIRKIASSIIKPKLLSNPNIGNVEVFGGYESAVMIKIDPFVLKKYNLTLNKVINSIRTIIKDTPIGFMKNDSNFFTLSYYGQKDNIEKLKNIFIAPNIKLADIADIKWTYQTNNSAYVGNNAEAIAISVQRPISGSVLVTSDVAREIMKEIQKEYPNIKIEISDTQRNLIETSNDNMLEALRDAIFYTLLVLLLFLANLRSLLAAAISIPMVFFGTIAYLYITGNELNIVIFTAIILALGMLTDDAVVVLENIERHMQEGDENAIYNGTKEVLKPVFAGTFSTIVVIFPLMFVGGYPEKIFKPLVETLIVSLLISWFVSITFIPKLAVYLYKNGTEKLKIERFFEKLYQNTFARLIPSYIQILLFSRKHFIRRILLIAGAIMLLVITVKNVAPTAGRDLMPPMDTGIMKANFEFSANLNVDETKNRIKPLLQWLNSEPWVLKTSISIGTEKGVLSLGANGGGNSVSMTIIATDRFHRNKTIWQLEQDLRDKIASLKGVKDIAVFDYGATALSTIKAPLDVQFRSDNLDELPNLAKQAKKALYEVKGLTTIKQSWDKDFQEVVIKIDTNKALYYGVTPLDIISQIALKDQGIVIYAYTSMKSDLIRVRFDKNIEKNIQILKTIPIITKKGEITLGDIAKIDTQFTYSKIDRYNLKYAIDLEGYRNTRPISKITDDSNEILKSHNINNYYQMGDIKEMNNAFSRLFSAIAVGIILLILTLMVVYRSLKLSIIMIIVLPLSLIGALWSLIIAGKPLCMPSMVGILLLFGIIIKNSVLLIDFYNEFRKVGNLPFESAIMSVKTRFRPVMMTAFSTIAGMIPIALEQAIGLERLSPIADVAIGGLLVGTILTLIYIPMFAYIVDKK